MRRIALITTGGTIEKTYDEQAGLLVNRGSIVRRMLSELRLEDACVTVSEPVSKDSLDMTDADRDLIVSAVRAAGAESAAATSAAADGADASDTDGTLCGIVVLHGTDTLALTGERLYQQILHPRVPIVLTGAMRPFEMKQSDALQNLTEAIFATGVVPPGVYCAAHGRVLPFPGVRKDRERGTFVR